MNSAPDFLGTARSLAFRHKVDLTIDGLPYVRVSGGLLSVNSGIALAYLELSYRLIPLIQDREGKWIPAVP